MLADQVDLLTGQVGKCCRARARASAAGGMLRSLPKTNEAQAQLLAADPGSVLAVVVPMYAVGLLAAHHLHGVATHTRSLSASAGQRSY